MLTLRRPARQAPRRQPPERYAEILRLAHERSQYAQLDRTAVLRGRGV